MKLILGIPKGSLQNATVLLFKKAGFNIVINERSLIPSIDDDEISLRLLRAQEIPRYVDEGILDAGLTGKDWIKENNAKVQEIIDLIYAKQGLRPVRWVLAVPEHSHIQTIKDLNGKKIATELVNVTKQYLKKNNIKAKVEYSWGSTEIKAPEFVDAIVELTETGASLNAHKLRIIDTLLESTTKLIANKKSWKNLWKHKKIESLSILLQGALLAEQMVGLKMNIHKDNLPKILELLPALKKPTISHLSNENWIAIDTIINEKSVKKLIPDLKRAGAQGIVEYPLNKVIY
ncbi:MAG: ATP phosphoribosyltransferase [bacterium]